ncbi:MAG: hypothetical protein ACRDNK_01350 [Solirubrobacteraceae bacterium]
MAIGHPPLPEKPKADRRSKRAEVALLAASDWHVGKQTVSFSSDVAEQRIQALAEKVARITEIERADHPVRECHLLLCGDFTDGVMVFPGQPFEIDSTLFTQMFRAANILEGLLRSLLETFPNVTVWAQTGNHGRIGHKGDMPRGDNTDRLLYRIVRERLGGEVRIAWHEPESWYTIVTIGDYRALLVHGDQVKSFGGTPVFAILKKANSWASGVLPAFRDVWMGHFHTDLRLSLSNGRGRVFVSPSIESDSAYAAEVVAAAGVPAQRLCFVDPERARVTSERLIWLD